MKSKIILALVAAALAAGFGREYRAVRQLEEETAALREQLAERNTGPGPVAAEPAPPEEANRLGEEHIELMKLRGQYSEWQRKSAESSAQIASLHRQLGSIRRELEQQAGPQAQDARRGTRDAAVVLARAEIAEENECVNNLVKINGAKVQWALENKLGNGAVPQDGDLFGVSLYIAQRPVCPAGGTYTLNAVGSAPTCTVAGHTLP
jgi:hypothetical protein